MLSLGLGMTMMGRGSGGAAAQTHVVGLLGQSNQRGAAPNDGGASYPAGMMVFNGTAVVTPSGGLPHIGGTGAGEPSIAIEFARQYLAANPSVTLIVVPCAQDGTGFASNNWNPGNSLYNSAVSRMNACMALDAGYQFRGFLWHQGERDGVLNASAGYQAALTSMVSALRSAVTGASATTPFVVGNLLESFSDGQVPQIRTILADAPNFLDYCGFASSTGLTGQDDRHFNAASLRTLGQRYYTAYVSALSDAPVEDTTPDAFSFVDQAGADPSAVVASNTITVAGINAAAAISVTGGEYRINGGAWVSSSGSVTNGQTVQVRGTASASYSTAVNVALTIGGVSDTFTITTRAQDSAPNAFSFTDVTDQPLSTVVSSNVITPTGYLDPAAISVTGGEYRIDGGAYTSASGTISPGSTVQVRGTSSGSNSATVNVVLTIGGVSDTFSITTEAASGGYGDVISIDLGNSSPLTASEEAGIYREIYWQTLSGTPNFNVTSGIVDNIGVETSLTLAGNAQSNVTTRAVDDGETDYHMFTRGHGLAANNSGSYAFGGIPYAEYNIVLYFDEQTASTSGTVAQVSDGTTTHTLTATGAPRYSGQTYTEGGASGNYVQFTGLSGPTQTITMTTSFGSGSFAFVGLQVAEVLGGGADTAPDAFAFTDATGQETSTLVASNVLTPVGYDTATAISVTGGEYRIDGGAWVSTPGTLSPGSTVQVRGTSSASNSATVDVVLTIGGVSDTFSITTVAAATGPASLFALGEEGAWYDPSDLSTLWQDAAGTVPVTADGDPVARMDDKSGRGHHLTNGGGTDRPLYRTSGGVHWLEFDGVNDALADETTRFGMVANPDITIVSAQRMLPLARATQWVASLGGNTSNGTLNVSAGTSGYSWLYGGGNEFYGPVTQDADHVCAWVHPAGGNYASSTFFRDGVEVTATAAGNPTGVPANSANGFRIGNRNGTAVEYANMRLYGMIVLDTSNSTRRGVAETWAAEKITV